MSISLRFFMAEVRVSDWERSVRWYREVLGLRVVMEDLPGRFTLLEADGGGRVAIKGADGFDDPAGQCMIRLVFEVADLDAVVAELVAKGVAIEGPSTSAEGYREIRVEDPDGTPIGLFSWVESKEHSV